MPVIPTFQTSPGQVPSTAGSLPRGGLVVPQPMEGGSAAVAAANQMVGATALTARAGDRLASFGQEFADKYIDAKMQVRAADDMSGLSRQLNEAQFASSKIPDRDLATADFNGRSQKILDDYAVSEGNPLIKSHVTARFAPEREMRLAATQRASFDLWSQVSRGKLIEQGDQATKMAMEATPALRDKIIEDHKIAIDGRVQSGAMNPEAGAKAKVDFESNVYRSQIELLMAKDPRLGVALYDVLKPKLNAVDSVVMGRVAEDQRNNVSAQAYVAQNMPVFGATTGEILHNAIVGQESGGRQFDAFGAVLTSGRGAKGVGQITPDTFAQFARPGESIANAADNKAVSKRITDYYLEKYNGDWQRAAVAYFSGEGNVAPAGSPTPWKRDSDDGKVKTSEYVEQVGRRLGLKGNEPLVAPAGDQLSAANVAIDKMIMDVQTDETKSLHERNAIVSQLSQRKAALNGLVGSQRKQLTDEAEAMGVKILNKEYVLGQLGIMRDKWQAAGDTGMAAAYGLLAQNETAVLDWIKAAPGTEDPHLTRLMAAIFPGKGAAVLKDMLVGQRGDRTVFREQGSIAHADMEKQITARLSPQEMRDTAALAIQSYARAGDPLRAQEILTRYKAYAQVNNALNKTPLDVERFEMEMRESIAAEGPTKQQTQMLQLLHQLKGPALEEMQKNPLSAFKSTYEGSLGPMQAFDYSRPQTEQALWWQKRDAQASAVGAATGVLPSALTPLEAADMKARLDHAKLNERKVFLAQQALVIPANQIPKVGEAIAKGPMGDIYNAALLAYKDGNMEVGDSILAGGNKWLEGGPQGKHEVQSNDKTWQAINDKLRPGRIGMDARAIEKQNNAIFARYVDLLGTTLPTDPPDTNKFNQAMVDVMGTPNTKNHTNFFLPKGVDSDQFDRAVGSLTQADVPPLKRDSAGREITLPMIKSGAGFRSIGNGKYEVWLDTADGPRALQQTNGKYWELDIKPFVARSSGLSASPAAAPPPIAGALP